jgi:hypothetical protein
MNAIINLELLIKIKIKTKTTHKNLKSNLAELSLSFITNNASNY